MSEYYFHLDHLTVGYDKKPLIKDICIGIEKGEIVTLIGPNGSGKSTILKSITRQLKLVGGNVEFDGKNLHELSFRELSTKMAVVLTERMKPELMTCHDIVATGRYPYTGRLGMLTREDIIRELYEIDNGSFDPCFGSIELPRPEGTPRVFVLAGGGTGIPVFRKLQKENVPFAAGVLYTNDIDYQLARILAMETVTEAPFQEISDEAFARACELMKSCERVIDTGVPVGMCNRRIEELRAEAKRLGKLAE